MIIAVNFPTKLYTTSVLVLLKAGKNFSGGCYIYLNIAFSSVIRAFFVTKSIEISG